MNKLLTSLIILPLLIPLIGVRAIWALEITVTGNGDGSANEVTTQVEQTTTVVQEAQTEINNEVLVDANTGENEITDNTGEATIETGSITTEAEISNEVNSSLVELGCCDTGSTTITITGNGTDSQNTVDWTQTNETQIQVYQDATINNLIGGNLNTGYNLVSGNGGMVMITTGNISGGVELKTQVNQAYVKVTQSDGGDILIKVSQNGSGSENTIRMELVNGVLVTVNNQAEVNNEVKFDLNTGKNSVYDNLGDVFIHTGDIDFKVDVENEINESLVIVDQCCDDKPEIPVEPPVEPPEPPVVPPNPPQPPGNGGPGPSDNGGSSNNNSGSDSGVGGAVLGAMLPATGTLDYLMAVLANILMLLFGCYLRLKSGRAPAAI